MPNTSTTTAPTTDNGLLTWDQAAAVFNVSLSTFKRMVHRDRIPFVTLGKRRRFDRADLAAYLQSCRVVPEGPSTNLPDTPTLPVVKVPKRIVPSVLSEALNKPGRKKHCSFTEKYSRTKP